MKSAVVVECVRSPVGRAHSETGFFRDVRADDLAVAVVEGLVEKSGVDPEQIEDCLMGNTQQQGEQGFCVARTAKALCRSGRTEVLLRQNYGPRLGSGNTHHS